MNTLRNDSKYEEAAAAFQVFMIHWLNTALEDEGILEVTKRKQIIQKFGFDFSIWTDQYWFKSGAGDTIYPCICFSSHGPSADVEDLGDMYVPTRSFSFKEYLNSCMDYYFKTLKEDISYIESGPAE